jgi:formylglycine-generating enzyme required for sulfatase activity/predicted GH43/DUF377 family glycosyl hydrolase
MKKTIIGLGLIPLLAPLFFTCQPWGSYDNPGDPKSSSYQGYPTVASSGDIVPVSPADGGTLTGTTLTISKVEGATAYEIKLAPSSSAVDASPIISAPSNIIDLSAYPTFIANNTSYYWKALAMSSNAPIGDWSPAASFTTNFSVPTATPIFSLAGGIYASDQSVTISCATPNATIYCTTDGTPPTTGSTKYTGAISVSGNGTSETIKAIALAPGHIPSGIASATYTINNSATAMPTFSPIAGTYAADQNVTLSCSTNGAIMYYTTDSSTPTTSSTKYTGTISVAGNGTVETIKAIAAAAGYATSGVASATYTINYQAVVTTPPTVLDFAGQFTRTQASPVLAIGTAGAWDSYSVSEDAVIFDGFNFKMWYTNYDSSIHSRRIGLASSTDGLNWTKNVSNPVLGLGGAGAFDDQTATVGSVIYDNGTYKMWYSGYDGSYERIGYATSPDGIAWTKYTSNPVMDHGPSGTFDSIYAWGPKVIKVGATYHMWYTGHSGEGSYNIGHATSPDGIAWTKDAANPVLTNSANGWDLMYITAGSVLYFNGAFHLWYSGFDGSYVYRIGYAKSADGVTWTKGSNNPVLNIGPSGGFDSTYVYEPSVLYRNGQLWMWYAGYAAPSWQIGLAKLGNPTLLTMMPITGGTFNNGTSNVTVSSFTMSATEVNQSQYQTVTGSDPSTFTGDTSKPVEMVTWYDAVEFCNKLSEREGLADVYLISGRTPATGYPITSATVTMDISKNGYRLPMEAEWEYAARGAQSTHGYTYAGSNTVDDVAWYSVNSGNTTHDVGTKETNELGLYDMSGNVWEWCWDWYGSYSSSAQTNPTGVSSGSTRVIRGGSWNYAATYCAVSDRGYALPAVPYNYFGFRVVARP